MTGLFAEDVDEQMEKTREVVSFIRNHRADDRPFAVMALGAIDVPLGARQGS
jgi:hypothetical protein